MNIEISDNIDVISKEYEELLLSLIRDRPAIYKKSAADHKDKCVLENSWQEIAAIMHDSVENCKKCWSILNKKYQAECLLREKESRSGSAASSRAKWVHFDFMRSLIGDSTHRRSHSNLSNPAVIPSKPSRTLAAKVNKKNKKQAEIQLGKTIQKIDSAVTSISNMIQESSSAPNLIRENSSAPNIIQDNSPETLVKLEDTNFLVSRIVLTELNKLSPNSAKKKRKQITNCLYDSDSDDNL